MEISNKKDFMNYFCSEFLQNIYTYDEVKLLSQEKDLLCNTPFCYGNVESYCCF